MFDKIKNAATKMKDAGLEKAKEVYETNVSDENKELIKNVTSKSGTSISTSKNDRHHQHI